MRNTPAGMDTVWKNGDFTGANAPMRRVTVQHPFMNLHTYAMQSTFRRVLYEVGKVPSFNPYPSGIDPTRGEPITNIYADYLFNSPAPPKELPNVKSVSWTRSIDTDVAECTIEFYNTAPLPLGEVAVGADLDQPGFYTAGRGTAQFSSRWKHAKNEWTSSLVPDNILRTYEGYGTDTLLGEEIGGPNYVPPERDSKLVLTGVWMIDEVKLSATGVLTCTCRDLGRLLMDHLNFLPVVPEDFYPVSYRDWSDKVTVLSKRNVVTESNNLEDLPQSAVGSGNDNWPESDYVGAKVYGHTHTHVLDGDFGSYWLSVGNASPGYRSAYEYVDIALNGATIEQLGIWTVGDGYNIYLSVMKTNGQWMDGPAMPYFRDGRGRYEEGIPYVVSRGGLQGEENVLSFGAITDVHLVRVWLGNLRDFGLAGQKFRAGIRELRFRGRVHRRTVTEVIDSAQKSLKPGPAGSNPGRIEDYTDIIKMFCAWSGLFWPKSAYLYHSDGTKVQVGPKRSDADVLGAPVQGRVWGDFMLTGVAPPEEITAENFDKKSMMDGITYIRDIIGFLFHIDESGSVQWRLSNVWTLGNWAVLDYAKPGRTKKMITIDERQVIMGLEASLDSRSVREGVFVANATGAFAALASGFNPNDTGLRRVAGWTDQNFSSKEEALVMADLITVRQLFQYRKDTIDIPANPAIQIDDQVRVFERVTSEGYIHYVMGISSTNDAETGQWTYSLQTHWLGDNPNGSWIFDKKQLSSATIAYIDSLINGSPEFVEGKSTTTTIYGDD